MAPADDLDAPDPEARAGQLAAAPSGAVEAQGQSIGLVPDAHSGRRGHEPPASGRPGGEAEIPAAPGAGRALADDPALSLDGRRGRRDLRRPLDRALEHAVE